MSVSSHSAPFRLLLGSVAGIIMSACRSDARAEANSPPPLQPDPLKAISASPLPSAPQTPGIHEQLLPPNDLRFSIAIPDGYDPERPVPLILALHYGGTVTPFYGRGLLEGLIEPALRNLGAIIVAPDRTAGNWANSRSEKQIIALLNAIQATYSIDAERTLITGYSLGGMGTWYLAARNQDRFKAAIPISGRPQSDTLSFEWHMPLYVIHSRADDVVPLAPTEATVSELREKGADITLVVVEGIPHFAVSSFVDPLSEAVPWIEKVWQRTR